MAVYAEDTVKRVLLSVIEFSKYLVFYVDGWEARRWAAPSLKGRQLNQFHLFWICENEAVKRICWEGSCHSHAIFDSIEALHKWYRRGRKRSLRPHWKRLNFVVPHSLHFSCFQLAYFYLFVYSMRPSNGYASTISLYTKQVEKLRCTLWRWLRHQDHVDFTIRHSESKRAQYCLPHICLFIQNLLN